MVRATTRRRGRTKKPFMSSLRGHAQRRYLCHRSFNLPRAVAAIGADQFEPPEAPAYLVEDAPGPVAIQDRGGVDDPRRQPFGIDQREDLSAPACRRHSPPDCRYGSLSANLFFIIMIAVSTFDRAR
jgi:hypothetical protein